MCFRRSRSTRGAPLTPESYLSWEAYDADVLVGDVTFRNWLESRQPGEAWDMTLEIRQAP